MRRTTGGLACSPSGRSAKAAQIAMTGKLFDALGTADLSLEAPRFPYLETPLEVASGPANELFVVPPDLRSLVGAVDRGGMADEDSKKARLIP